MPPPVDFKKRHSTVFFFRCRRKGPAGPCDELRGGRRGYRGDCAEQSSHLHRRGGGAGMMHRPAPHCRDLRFERSPHHVGQSRKITRQKFLVFIAGCFIKAISDDLIRSDDFNLDFGNIRIPDELNTTMTKWNDRRGRSRWRQDFGQHASQGKTERVLAHFGRSAAVPIILSPVMLAKAASVGRSQAGSEALVGISTWGADTRNGTIKALEKRRASAPTSQASAAEFIVSSPTALAWWDLLSFQKRGSGEPCHSLESRARCRRLASRSASRR